MTIWWFLIMSAAVLSAILFIASMFKLDRYDDALEQSFKILGMAALYSSSGSCLARYSGTPGSTRSVRTNDGSSGASRLSGSSVLSHWLKPVSSLPSVIASFISASPARAGASGVAP
jgi:hypothetical protein